MALGPAVPGLSVGVLTELKNLLNLAVTAGITAGGTTVTATLTAVDAEIAKH